MITNGFVTLYRFDNSLGEYTRIGSFSAWIYRQMRTKTTPDGVQAREVYDVRIPHKIDAGLKSGDLIFFEKTYSHHPDLRLCSRVAAVTENRTGSAVHWHIEAENQYR